MNFRINDYKLLQTNYDPSREVIDYGVRMVGAPLEWGETMGEGIKVGIIDTGIDSDHFELKNRIKDGINTWHLIPRERATLRQSKNLYYG